VSAPTPKFLFLDLETSGLSPKTNFVLEIAAIVTDDTLEELSRFHALIVPRDLEDVSKEVREMHTKSGLWGDAIANGGSRFAKWDAFYEWLKEKCAGEKLYLAGSSVHFDRAFLPDRFLALLSHRMLDLRSARTFLEIAGMGSQLSKNDAEVQHRAMGDIEFDLKQAREFVALLKTVPA
jgi:oligoribonuclease